MRRFFGTAVFAVALLMFSALPAGAVSSAQLKAKALSLSNFPTGWSVDNHQSSSAADKSACLKNLTVSGKHDAKVTVKFNQGTVPALKEDLETGPSAASRYREATAQLSNCKQISFTSDGQSASGTVGAMSFPTIGSQSAAYSVSISIQGVTAGLDIVAFKVGKYIGDVIYEDLGTPDLNQFQAFVTEAVNKIEGKPTTTPTTF
jgi:hypothetical protein